MDGLTRNLRGKRLFSCGTHGLRRGGHDTSPGRAIVLRRTPEKQGRPHAVAGSESRRSHPLPDKRKPPRDVVPTRAVNTTSALQNFILQHTHPTPPPLVPELTLRLSVGAIALWEALEAHTGLRNLPPPYWAFAWPGGQAVARHVLDHPELVRGKTVLDFAAGGGIQAIAAARAGAARLLATEIDVYATEAMRVNAALNDVAFEVSAEDVIDQDLGWDVVLAGDVCYERPMAERVERWLSGLARRGALVLMGDPGRNYLPKKGLVEVARHVVPTTRDLEDRDSRTTLVWRFTGAVA